MEARLLFHGAIDIGADGSPAVAATATTSSTAAALTAAKHPLSAVPALSSDPGAPVKVYLDFLGAPAGKWGTYNATATPAYDTDGDPTTFTDQELANIREIWARIAEKYSPFNVNITTVNPGTLVHGRNLAVILGGNGSWTGGFYGGFAFVGNFLDTSRPDSVYIFPHNLLNGYPHYVAEDASHEIAHAFGLNHQSVYSGKTLVSEYAGRQGMVSPVMGTSLSDTRGIWWDGQSSVSSTTWQDDMATIASSANGFGYRAQDHGQTIATASPLSLSGTTLSGSGIIETTSDKDFFSFSSAGGAVSLNVNVAPEGPTLHARAQLFDAAGNVLATAANSATLGQSIAANLPAGRYYLAVESYGKYGDVGQYTVSGTLDTSTLTNPSGPPSSVYASGASISGTFFYDSNGNGSWDTGEAPSPYWLVYIDSNNNGLYDSGERQVRGDAGGRYTFSGLAAGQYTLRPMTAPGWRQTFPVSGAQQVTVTAGQSVTGINIGEMRGAPATTGSISGAFFYDSNGNGAWDSNETFSPSWLVYLDQNHDGVYDPGDVQVRADSSGRYTFSGLAAGTYSVRAATAAGWTQTLPAGGAAQTVTISAGQSVTGINFGEVKGTPVSSGGGAAGSALASISGTFFYDSNGNGAWDSNETCSPLWYLYLDANNDAKYDAGDTQIRADSQGRFTFSNLQAGTYVIRAATASGWQQTAPAAGGARVMTVAAGQSVTDVFFGERRIA